MKRTKRGPTKKLDGRYIITEVGHDGEPIAPGNAARKFVTQRGCLLRDHIPISFRMWKSNNPKDRSVVPQREKDMIWHELKQQFTLPEGSEELVKKWTLKKMAEQFQTFKKNLTNMYIKQGKTPTFTGDLEKLKDHWDEFMQYKCSDLGTQ